MFSIRLMFCSMSLCGQQASASCPTCRSIQFPVQLQSCSSRGLLWLKSPQPVSLTLKLLLNCYSRTSAFCKTRPGIIEIYKHHCAHIQPQECKLTLSQKCLFLISGLQWLVRPSRWQWSRSCWRVFLYYIKTNQNKSLWPWSVKEREGSRARDLQTSQSQYDH